MGPCMKILMYRWKIYMQNDIISAFNNMGHQVEIFDKKLENHNVDKNFTNEISDLITEQQYDFVFTVNYFGAVSDGCQRCNVKYVAWTCDSPLISMHHQSIFNECNYIFIFDKVNFYMFQAAGVKNIFYLPLAVDTNRMDAIISNANDLHKYNRDISFVGSMYEKNSYDDIKSSLSDYLRGYFDAAMLAQLDIFGENILDRLLTSDILSELMNLIDFHQDKRSFSNIALVFSTTFLGFKVASMERIKCLNELAKKYMVDLYTDSNSAELIGVNNIGSVDYHKDMSKVFHQSKINLNFTIKNIRSGIPLRVWDVLGAGGFLVTNFQAEIPQYFENGKDLVYFDSIDDMSRKVEYYLIHEDERMQIARNGYKKVKKYHSYESRLKQIILAIQ